MVPLQVRDEAGAWPLQGAFVTGILDGLEHRGCLEYAAIEPLIEGPLYTRLHRTLGQGEAAAIAIAFHRRGVVAVDDRQARKACDALVPRVPWVATEQMLSYAVADGKMARAEVEAIWAATKINDPKRFVP